MQVYLLSSLWCARTHTTVALRPWLNASNDGGIAAEMPSSSGRQAPLARRLPENLWRQVQRSFCRSHSLRHRKDLADIVSLLELFAGNGRRNVYAGELEVRPPPTPILGTEELRSSAHQQWASRH
jgi:hypothetical protein